MPRPFAVAAVAAVVAGALLTACRMSTPSQPTEGDPARVVIGAVTWYVDYDAALEVARAQDKALWVHFGENPG